jgi:hypothetical protein
MEVKYDVKKIGVSIKESPPTFKIFLEILNVGEDSLKE